MKQFADTAQGSVAEGLPGDNTAQCVERALSYIHVNELPLNPDTVQEVVSSLSPGIPTERVSEYMGEEYGWNENFTSQTLYE